MPEPITRERLVELIPYIEDALISLSAKNDVCAAITELLARRDADAVTNTPPNSRDHDPDYPQTRPEPPGCQTLGAAWDGPERRKGQRRNFHLSTDCSTGPYSGRGVCIERRKPPEQHNPHATAIFGEDNCEPKEERSGRERRERAIYFGESPDRRHYGPRRCAPGTRADRAEDQRPNLTPEQGC